MNEELKSVSNNTSGQDVVSVPSVWIPTRAMPSLALEPNPKYRSTQEPTFMSSFTTETLTRARECPMAKIASSGKLN